MLDPNYINNIQHQLTNFYKNNIDNKDDHYITVYTSSNSDDGFIIYQPNWMADHNDNDGKTMPTRYVIIHAETVDGHKWSKLTNQQFIHSQRLTSSKYEWNLNYRRDNDISFTGQKSLKKYLLSHFNVRTTKTGLLVVNVTDKLLTAFENLIAAIQYISHYGYDYICTNHISDVKMDSIVKHRQARLNSERLHIQQEKRKHSSGQKKHTTGPKAHGKVVRATSSISGTPRMIRLRHEAKLRKEHKAYLKKHPDIAKKERQAKIHKQLAQNLSGSKIVTVGRFSVSHAQIIKLIKKCHAVYQVNINNNTDYVLANKPNSSKKYKMAIKEHIPIITESNLRALIKNDK